MDLGLDMDVGICLDRKKTRPQSPIHRHGSPLLDQVSGETVIHGPEDAVLIDVNFSSLPDGTNHVEQVILASAKKELQIKNANFDYRKVGP